MLKAEWCDNMNGMSEYHKNTNFMLHGSGQLCQFFFVDVTGIRLLA